MALDVIDTVISRITHHEPGQYSSCGKPFLIARTADGHTVKGEMWKPIIGEHYRFYGEWMSEKNPKYPGLFFRFQFHEVLFDPSVAGLAYYLRRYVDGLGIVKASAIVEAFGDDTLRLLRAEPERALAVHGITPTIVESIRRHFEEEVELDPAAFARLIDLFAGHHIPKKVVKRLLEDWGSDAPAKVLESPYMLLAYPRMGWKTVDAWATTVARYDRRGIDRHVAAIVEALEQIAGDGHTYGTRQDVEAVAFGLIGGRPRSGAWEAAIRHGLIVVEREESGDEFGGVETFALPKLWAAERTIAERLELLARTARPLPLLLAGQGLNEDQLAAMRMIEANGVAILAGSPGTGKSFSLANIITELNNIDGLSIRVVAPTGKAAKRTAELLEKSAPGASIPCTTIHRALGPKPSEAPEGVPASDAKVGRGRDEFGFAHNESNPIDADFLVVEEASMIDACLAASLLRAVAPGTRVVFVGDPNQLPSVGPGSVLRDMIAAGVPTATLTKIVRSDGGGRVVRACHAIKDGRMPEPAERIGLPTENWIHLEIDDPREIAREIVERHRVAGQNGNFDPTWDMQVVTPQKTKLPIACEALNRMLSALLNPLPLAGQEGGGPSADGEYDPDEPPGFASAFRPGDKVVRRKNGLADEMVPVLEADERADWTWNGVEYRLREIAVVNGDLGQVIDIVPGDKESWAVVRFRIPDRLCRLPMSEHHLFQAYAVTAHVAQGSGYPYVVVPVHHSFYWDAKTGTGLFCREWLYSAVSRAEVVLVTIGPFSAVRAAVSRKTVHQRRTRLAEFIAACGGPRGGLGVEMVEEVFVQHQLEGVTP